YPSFRRLTAVSFSLHDAPPSSTYPLSLHDALPISRRRSRPAATATATGWPSRRGWLPLTSTGWMACMWCTWLVPAASPSGRGRPPPLPAPPVWAWPVRRPPRPRQPARPRPGGTVGVALGVLDPHHHRGAPGRGFAGGGRDRRRRHPLGTPGRRGRARHHPATRPRQHRQTPPTAGGVGPGVACARPGRRRGLLRLRGGPVIPEIVHVIWIGPRFFPYADFLESWSRHNPGWQVRLWTDENRPHLGVNEQIYRRLPAQAMRADLLRLHLLAEYGGLYSDADSTCLAPVDLLEE